MIKITKQERKSLYKTIYNRRDTRSEFLKKKISKKKIIKLLDAAHHAPSVGYMQPWDFIVIKKRKIKQKIKNKFKKANKEAIKLFNGKRKKLYKNIKLEGIMEAPIGICITCTRDRTGDVVLGRTANLDMDIYSTVCAIQNLWLAARAENIGVGWVSIIHNKDIQDVLNIPDNVIPIAYLCLGYVSSFHKKPELEELGWLPRIPLNKLIHYNVWKNQ